MTTQQVWGYKPTDSELERASNSYLMSLIAVLAGLPIPVFNLLASVIFYLGNRKSTLFVKWHCTQALIAQLSLFFFNSALFWWTIAIIFKDAKFTNDYFAYLITIVLFNVFEFVTTLYAAIQVRKGNNVEIFFIADLTYLFCPKPHENTI